MLGITQRQAGKIINEVNRRMAEKGYITIKARPPRAPLDSINEYLGIGGNSNVKHRKNTQQNY